VQIEAIRQTPASLTADASYGKVVPRNELVCDRFLLVSA